MTFNRSAIAICGWSSTYTAVCWIWRRTSINAMPAHCWCLLLESLCFPYSDCFSKQKCCSGVGRKVWNWFWFPHRRCYGSSLAWPMCMLCWVCAKVHEVLHTKHRSSCIKLCRGNRHSCWMTTPTTIRWKRSPFRCCIERKRSISVHSDCSISITRSSSR